MCRITTTRVETPYPGFRQILSRSVLYQGEDEMPAPQQWQAFTRIPEEERYSLMAFLMARKWSIACDILADHPSLVAPWALNFLRDMMRGEQFSAKDVEVFRTHILVLGLAQTLGIRQTRALLKHLDR